MYKHNVLIVEDNLIFAIKVERHLIEWGHKVLGVMDNSTDAIVAIESNRPSLILMDININGQASGIDIAEKIKAFNIPIIFITGLRDIESFQAAKEMNGIQYLVKPFDMLTLKAAIEFSVFPSPLKENENTLFIRKRKELIKVKIVDIDWVKSDGNYCDLYCGKTKHTMKISLKNLMLQLDGQNFLRIHRSYAVRKEIIKGVLLTNNQLRIGDEFLPIGRKYRIELFRELNLE